jgi:exopolysaccharide biosynthesis protein
MKIKIKKLPWRTILISAVMLGVIGSFSYYGYTQNQQVNKTRSELENTSNELEELKNQDPHKVNEELEEEIGNIQKTYQSSVSVYEDLLELKEISKDTEKLDELFTKALLFLSKRNYSSASATLINLGQEIQTEQDKIIASFVIPESVPVQNTPPGAGYSRQQVQTDAGTFMVSVIAADMGNTKVIVDTASDSTCGNECPVLPLATYVSRSNAFAGVNGSYFCPATYPSCAGKTNSFDTLLMNKNKTYFNSDNNVYSNNPAVIFSSGSVRFVAAASQWGRDTGIDSMISNYPLLVFNSNISFGGDDDPKKGSKGSRSFVASKGSTIYIGVVHNATVAESARVMKAMGMENALNLDNGGSTALWSGGYKVGPGRNLPNTILFVRR